MFVTRIYAHVYYINTHIYVWYAEHFGFAGGHSSEFYLYNVIFYAIEIN